jgi:hypothetical protein
MLAKRTAAQLGLVSIELTRYTIISLVHLQLLQSSDRSTRPSLLGNGYESSGHTLAFSTPMRQSQAL